VRLIVGYDMDDAEWDEEEFEYATFDLVDDEVDFSQDKRWNREVFWWAYRAIRANNEIFNAHFASGGFPGLIGHDDMIEQEVDINITFNAEEPGNGPNGNGNGNGNAGVNGTPNGGADDNGNGCGSSGVVAAMVVALTLAGGALFVFKKKG